MAVVTLKKGRLCAACLLAFFGGMLSPVLASEPVFFPDRGLLFPDSLESPFQDIGYVFSNPSHMAQMQTAPTVKLESAPSFIGYQQLSFSGIYPIEKWTFFAGYAYFGSSDLTQTRLDNLTGRPIPSGRFSHDYQQGLFGAVYQVPEWPIQLSGALEWVGQNLDTEQVGGFGVGTGVRWSLAPSLWTSLYLRRMIQPQWLWSSKYRETLDSYILMSVGYMADQAAFSLETDWTLWRSRGEIKLGSYFSFFGDVVSVKWQNIQRIGLGVDLHLSPIRLQYTRLLFSDVALDANYDLFGIGIEL